MIYLYTESLRHVSVNVCHIQGGDNTEEFVQL